LGISPLDFYEKNLVYEDTVSQDNGRPMESVGPRPALARALEVIDYRSKWHAPGTRTLPDGRLHGIGVYATNDSHGSASSGSGMEVYMNSDGTANYTTGISNVMNGCNSVAFALIIAETLGMPFENVTCSGYGNPHTSMDGGGQYGSRAASCNGRAAMMAALDIRQQMFEFLAGEWEVNVDDFDARDGKIFLKSDETKSITHAEVMSDIDGPIMGKGIGFENGSRIPFQGQPAGQSVTHRQGIAAIWEVAVDPETGEVEILDFVNVGDCGRVIDRMQAEAQVLSAMWSQAGKVLMWEVKYDPQTGALLHQSHLENKAMTAMDITEPDGDLNKSQFIETIGCQNAFGMMGIGEPTVISCTGALTEAINNAIGIDGKICVQRPMTPSRILEAMGKA